MGFLRILASLLFLFRSVYAAEENFLLVNGITDEIVFELGPHINERNTPASTFKMALSLIGFDAGVLVDEKNPMWDFQEGYDDYLESWKAPQSPHSWMEHSCIWYSKILVVQLGLETMQNYLDALEYGNRDMSGGLTRAWVSSSLKISPMEQVVFIRKMIQGKLPISSNAIKMTKALLYKEELPDGWELFGKTGLGSIGGHQIGWFVGWIEKDHTFFLFAYNIRDKEINPAQRIPRVKELIAQSKF